MAPQPDQTRPTVVLVHGARADASAVAGVIRAPQDRGSRVIGFADVLRGPAEDASYRGPRRCRPQTSPAGASRWT